MLVECLAHYNMLSFLSVAVLAKSEIVRRPAIRPVISKENATRVGSRRVALRSV